jgi:predicted nucleic acid-binding protein
MTSDLARLPRVAIDRDVERLAVSAQRELAEVGHHHLPSTDVVIAACAHVAGMGVLHYDHDYDLIREQASLEFESVWLAPAGAL